jgi:hypothetical protein
LVNTQSRAELDSLVDYEFALAVLRELPEPLYLSSDHWLRARRHEHTDHPLSMSEAFERYGGEVIEDVLEKGSKNVAPMKL